ncbi:MAG: DegT/DnrJ/EryC1/StrS family aminotransferase [Firmicutes bacterium]|nr:DegT/DnrJ/EryC1/StrS family aminotransferase [Bacillota bacterium]
MSTKIPFSPPDITEAEINEVAEAMRSGWITTGPRTKEFERQLSAYVGNDKTVALNSATAAMELTLHVLGIGPGDEVLVPAYTYTASCSVICHVGATPVMVDISKDSFEMDYDRMAEAITEKTKAIIPVDLGGVICDYDAIYHVVKQKKDLFRPANERQKLFGRVIVIADCAHGLGAFRSGKMAGAFADFTCFSFHAVKNLTTAEGGAVTWRPVEGLDEQRLYQDFQNLSLHGQTKDALHKDQPGAWEYDIVAPYYKCNMTDITAAIGLVQLKRYPDLLKRRFEIIDRFDKVLHPLGVETLPHVEENGRSSGHLYITRIPGIGEEERNEIIVRMAEKGIACNVHYKPLPMLTAYKNLGFRMENYPNAYEHFRNEITLPLFSKLTDEQVDTILDAFVEIVKDYL